MKRRALIGSAIVVVLTLATLLAPGGPLGGGSRAEAANASDFNAGLIISDALFYNGSAMTADAVQSFVASKETGCKAGATCLKDYKVTTPNMPAVAGLCGAYQGAPNESASSIIAKVGAACNISQAALIVILEKEQGLVSATSPGAGAYAAATGFGCPDTGSGCDQGSAGFFVQVYNAGLQFQLYAANPTRYNYRAGQNNSILYAPGCTSSTVFIQNKATAGLYDYTPYQPNADALANLYGSSGNPCSSYGNRNFWRIYSDWFGNPLVGVNLVRTADNATVYLVAATVKYPIASLAVLAALSPLGGVGTVSPSYLDGFATQQVMGRTIRGSDGSIYFIDSGIKLPFSSCSIVADYGGSCASDGYAQLTDAQIAAFANGPRMTNVLATTAGNRYWISAGVKHQVLDDASLAAAGIPAGANVLSEDSVSALPLGTPVARDGVFVAQSGAGGYVLLSGGKTYPVDPSATVFAGLPGSSAGSLSSASLATLPAGGIAFTGAYRVPGASQGYVLGTSDGTTAVSFPWTPGVGGAPSGAFVPVAQAFADSFPAQAPIAAGGAVKSPSSGTVFLVMPSKVLPVGAWESLTALSNSATPRIATVSQGFLATLPQGAVALTAGTLVRSPADATVYLINGVTNKIPFSSFVFPSEAGVSTFSTTSQDRLDAYPTASTVLQFAVSCGSQNYVSAGGSIHAVPAALAGSYPFSYMPLDQFTCALLSKGADAGQFIRTPDGSIYQLSAGKKLPIASIARWAQLSNGQSYLNVASEFAAMYPTGPLA